MELAWESAAEATRRIEAVEGRVRCILFWHHKKRTYREISSI